MTQTNDYKPGTSPWKDQLHLFSAVYSTKENEHFFYIWQPKPTFAIFWSYYIMYQTCYIFSKHYFSNCQHFCIHRHEKHLSLLIGEVFNNKSEQNSKKKLSLIINWDLKYDGALSTITLTLMQTTLQVPITDSAQTDKLIFH